MGKYMNHNRDDNYRLYSRARNKAKKTVKKERKIREKEIAESAKSNCKNFWAYINSKRKTRSGISELHDTNDGKTFIASSDQEKAEVLAKYFTSVFTNERDGNLPNLENIVFQQFSNDDDIKPEEVNKLLKDLNTTKSPGPDQVHPINRYH